MSPWERLGSVDAEPLIEARLQLHWAAQIAAAPGKQLLPPQPDASAQSFQWDAGAGAAFCAHPEACAEVARWYANADRLLRAVQAANPEASPVRCWPHHFDLATLLTLDPAAAGPESARSIGIGLSPGDAARPGPYFYVTPWPYPQSPALPALKGGGSWNTEGWLGAVLEARALAGSTEQEGQVREFLTSAIAAARRLIDTV
jgi:hypothetical protein